MQSSGSAKASDWTKDPVVSLCVFEVKSGETKMESLVHPIQH